MFSYLIVTPLLFLFFAFINSVKIRNTFVIASVCFLALLSFYIFFDASHVDFVLPHIFHKLFIVLDVLLLGYFLHQGIVKKSKLVSSLAVLQIVLYLIVLNLPSTLLSSDILIDKISTVMYLVINVVGGLIIIYALGYIESEKFGRLKKNAFIAMLFFFLSVMNFIVSTNNIEIFFMLFEMTTLCSYVLIGYRADEISNKNAIQALWMNQIGGVAILVALIFSITHYETLYFDKLISHVDSAYLLPIVFLAVASFVKGASIPFDKWLLGAMVAPTPVSAILHSATMVKIAPFLMIKLSFAMNGFLSTGVAMFGSFVFFSASLLALSKDYFKEILGLSTIALLALMMTLAAIGTPEAINACLVLIVFHAVSKAMLFLQMGILEKQNHLKYVQDINSLISFSPLVVFFIVMGFASLTLPPFGAFVGKLMAIEFIAKEILTHPLYALVLVFVALGSTFLTLLYFKVLTKLFTKDMDETQPMQKMPKLFFIPSFVLFLLLIFSTFVVYKLGELSSIQIVVPLVLISLVLVLFSKVTFKNAQRVKEYYCGEKDEVKLGMYYFDIDARYKKLIHVVCIMGILALILGVAL